MRIDDDMTGLTLAMAEPAGPGATLTLTWDGHGTAPTASATIGCQPIGRDGTEGIARFIREHTDDEDPGATAAGFTHLWEAGEHMRATESLTPIGIHVSLSATIDLTAHCEDHYAPGWDGWDDESTDLMLADIGQKAARLAAAISWHQYNLKDGPDKPADSRRPCLELIDDLRGLLNRDATAS